MGTIGITHFPTLKLDLPLSLSSLRLSSTSLHHDRCGLHTMTSFSLHASATLLVALELFYTPMVWENPFLI